jgi:transposase
MKNVHFFEREIGGRRYRLVADSVWDSAAQRSVARQVVLGPVGPLPVANLGEIRTVGKQRIGDVGALLWVAERLDVVGHINRACGSPAPGSGPTVGEMVLAVAVQRACEPGPKCDLADFIDSCMPRASCLRAGKFTGQAFHRLSAAVSPEQLQEAQTALAKAAVQRFELSTDVLAFDTTNFDTHIATTTPGQLAQRGHAKSKRSDLRVVGLGLLVSETGHVPLLHQTYPGNSSDQAVLQSCLDRLGELHDALDAGEGRTSPSERTVVRDGGFWSAQLELELEFVGYCSIISLPLGHAAAREVLEQAAKRGAMKRLQGPLSEVRAFRRRVRIGELDRTLVVVESKELLEGQKRGLQVALNKAKKELHALEERVRKGNISRARLSERVKQALRREHLASFVVVEIGGEDSAPTFSWRVDSELRLKLETTRLGRRVLCTDRHSWSTERIVHAFRGQWNVEELFRRAKGGGVVPWGPSFQWADSSLRVHTFATVLGLMLVSLVRLTLGSGASAKATMEQLAGINAVLLRYPREGKGRPVTVPVPASLSPDQVKAVERFELDRWLPSLLSWRPRRKKAPGKDASTRH